MFSDRPGDDEPGAKSNRRRTRKVHARKPRYTRGEWALGRRGKDFVAEFRGSGVAKGKHGKRVRIGSFPSEDDARKAFDQWVDSLTLVKKEKANTIGAMWAAWLKERAKDGLSNKIYGFNWVAMEPHFGHLLPSTITADTCREYAKKRFDAGIAPATVHTELSRLRHCFKWATDNLLIDRAPKVWIPPKGKGRRVVLTRQEARDLLEAAKKGDPHIVVFVAILFATGARHHAITELGWSRVNFEANTIDFNVDGHRDPMSKAYTKGRAVVLMNRVCLEVLIKAYKGRQTEWVIEHGGRNVKDCRRGFNAAVKRAGITKRITPHTIRHSIVSWLQEQKDLATRHVSQLVGHVDEATTRLHYTHMSPDALQTVVGVLDEVFAPLPIGTDTDPEKQRSEELFSSITSRLGRVKLDSKAEDAEEIP